MAQDRNSEARESSCARGVTCASARRSPARRASASRGVPLAQAHLRAARGRRRAAHADDGDGLTVSRGRRSRSRAEVGKRIAEKAKEAGVTQGRVRPRAVTSITAA